MVFWHFPALGGLEYVLKKASRLYVASWVKDIGPDLRSNDYKKDDGTEGKSNGDKSRSTETESSTLEDIAIAARGVDGDFEVCVTEVIRDKGTSAYIRVS